MQKLLMLQAFIQHLNELEPYVNEGIDGFMIPSESDDFHIYISFGDEGYLYRVWEEGCDQTFAEWEVQAKWKPLETVSQLKKLIAR